MPRLSIWLVRAALIHLLLGLTIGALLLAHKGMPFAGWLWWLLPVHIEILLLGWLLQLAMGVAYWILPRFYTVRPRSWLVWLALLLLNGGILFVSVNPLLSTTAPLLLIGRTTETLAVLAFAGHAWPRIKAIALEPANRKQR